MQVLEHGLTYQQLATGSGKEARVGDKVSVHYTGRLADGKSFESSLDRGKPFPFRLGRGHVIKGWDLGIVGMREGERRRLVIPPDLGYGSSGGGPVPPHETLTFDIELVDVD